MNRRSVFSHRERRIPSDASPSDVSPLEGADRECFGLLCGKGFSTLAVAGTAILFLFAIFPCRLIAKEDSLSEKVATAIANVTRKNTPAIVRVRCIDGHGELNGTGFYIDPSGTICTLAEIVRGGRNISVLHNGVERPASLVAMDPRSGVAFLKTSLEGDRGNGAFLSPHQVAAPPPLTPVLGIGFLRDERAIPSLGMITGSELHEGDHLYCIPHYTAIIPLGEGEAGSPVFDLAGRLLGMVVSGSTQPPGCRIFPATALEKLHHDILRFGRLESGWLGIVVEQAAVPQETSTARILSVEAGSPAENAGLKRGDMLLSLGGHQISNPEDVPAITFFLTAGDSVSVSVLRDGKVCKLELHCIERPDDGNSEQSADQKAPLTKQGTP